MALAAAAAVAAAAPALAHHGWAWAETQQSSLAGVVQSVSMTPPHPSLQIKARDGAVWRVDLGNPGLTARSGFVEGSAKVGDSITVLGNRALDRSQRLMKAVRLTVGGKTYDIYPDRIRPS